MNNNRGNNRRRGRGNNRQQGGGQQLNRIDSRARGNAPQLLEKYRKLAHDAHLNGDRVTEEYYLQFADHYFRVIADQRQRQEEQRQQRQDRWQDGGDGERYDNDSQGEYGDGEYSASPYNYGERREREEAPRHADREKPANTAEQREEANAGEEHNDNAQAQSIYEPTENPFTRDNRTTRATKPRRTRRDTAQASEGETRQPEQAASKPGKDETASSQLDFTVLPPAISSREEPAPAPVEAAEPVAEAKPKRRTTRRKPPADDTEALQAAS